MRDVLGTALQIANPAYEIRLGEITASPPSLSLEVGIAPIRAHGSFAPRRWLRRSKDIPGA